MEPMKEEDIRQYFLQNGGSVRNTDIVNYFRAYLSNPAIRDQARVLFKTYVNKLASVKVENGEKFLVLKRQYFQTPTDVNGNPKQSAYGGPPGSGGLASTTMYGSGGNINAHGYNNQQQAYSTPSNVNHLRRQNSQSQLYGSQFSLSSNYDTYGISNSVNTSHYQHHNASGLPSSATAANFYPASHYSQPPAPTAQIKSPPQQLPLQNINTQQQPIYGSASDFPPEYGLPTLPNSNTVTSPRRFVSPQNSYGSSNSGGSSSSRAPPPYRPPPPAGRFTTSPPNSGLPHGISRRSSMTAVGGVVPYQRTHSVPGTGMGGPASYYSTSSTQNINALMEPSVGMYQYHRSASVTGLPIAVNNSVATAPSSSDYSKYFDTLTGAPPPPVPPRSRRSVERSPSAANSYSSSSITSSHNNHHQGELRRLATKKMDTERMNGGDNNSSSSSDSSPSSANSIQPQHLQQRIHGTSSASSGPTMQNQMRLEKEIDNGMMDAEQEKENINNLQVSDGSINHIEHDRTQSSNLENGNSEVEAKISVRERMQKFNNIASECELAGVKVSSSSRNRRDIAAKHESGDFDTASLSSLDPKSKEWMINAMKCQYPVLNKMAQENPALVRRRDMNGTALHWAAKMGNLECVKLLAGTYKAEVNIKSNGGYTPLHLAAQFGRQDCYDVLIKTYNADANNRDHSGKKPMQYLVRQDASLSMDTFKSEYFGKATAATALPPRSRRHHSTAANFSYYNTARLPSDMHVTLPTCNSNIKLPDRTMPPPNNTSISKMLRTNKKPHDRSRNLTGPVQLLSFSSFRKKPNSMEISKQKEPSQQQQPQSRQELKPTKARFDIFDLQKPKHGSLQNLRHAGSSLSLQSGSSESFGAAGIRSSIRRGIRNFVDNSTPKTKKTANTRQELD